MKRLLILVLALEWVFIPLLGQIEEETKKPKTKLEEFLATKGKMIVKEFQNIGTISPIGGWMDFKTITLYTPGMESIKVKGLLIEIKEYGTVTKTHSSFLDMEEIRDVSRAITYMTDLATEWRKASPSKEYTEVIFLTKGDFAVGFYQSGKEIKAFSYSGSIGRATIFFKIEDLAKLKGFIDNALSILESK